MNEKRLKISAVLPAYNSAERIGRTIQSVLSQNRPPDEIVVVNDGSTDRTSQVVRSFGKRVKLIEQQNQGASAARNAGIKAAEGDWIAFLDSDDEWLERHLETQERILLENPFLVWSAANHINNLESENKSFPFTDPAAAKEMLNGKDYHQSYFRAFRKQATGCTDTVVIKRDVLFESGLFREQQKIANDLDMWFRIAHKYPSIGYSPEPAAIYHLDAEWSISRRLCTIEEFSDLLRRHIKLAQEAGSLEAFSEHIGWQVPAWCRASLFDKRAYQVRQFAKQFSDYLPAWKYFVIMTLTINPGLTMKALRAISRVVRKTGLRKRAVRPPKRIDE
ncbi:glycosyltransferase family 2 protein [Sedimentisphaera salicampi]|uniref:Putative glycosyltransferase EpsJ n=1 Tax=Sedimentisphaera salicampi TaxID=1941349 RepID=A0A1W6LKU4_9BACT|nr:glycosyltransferase family A protein [Sedimentisphaera salicampi]ARN56397.1 putative glycosyltransferase EpsJ [Sedimentisphaera salicampi]